MKTELKINKNNYNLVYVQVNFDTLEQYANDHSAYLDLQFKKRQKTWRPKNTGYYLPEDKEKNATLL